MTIYNLSRKAPQVSGSLSSHPRIVRLLTEPENALATALQWTEVERTASAAPLLLTTEATTGELAIHTPSFKLTSRCPLASVVTSDGSEFIWPHSDDPGLTSGTLGTLVSSMPSEEGSGTVPSGPSKPLPVPRKRKREDKHPGLTSHSVDDRPAKLPIPSSDDPTGAVESTLRRSTRTRTVVRRGL